MKPVPYKRQVVMRRPGSLAASEQDSTAAPLYADEPGERPTWDALPAELRRWVDANLPISHGFDASYATDESAPALFAWGTLTRSLALLYATRDSAGRRRGPTWTAQATVVPEGAVRLKRATLPAVPATTTAGGSKESSPLSLPDDIFSNLPQRVQDAIRQAVPQVESQAGTVLYGWEARSPTLVEASQELWYVRISDAWNVAGAYAVRSMPSPNPQAWKADVEAFVRSTQPWRTVAFRAQADWSFGAFARVTPHGDAVLPPPRSDQRPALGR